MARDDAPPFSRGETFYNGTTIDSNNLGGLNLEGQTRVFEDLDYSKTGARPARTNRPVKCMIVRNVSGINLLPKRLVTFQKSGTDGRFLCGRVDGYATVDGADAFPVDEFLPAAGVVNNDLFYVVIEGPAKVLTALDGGADNLINVGDALMSLTAATSQATTAGRVQPQANYVAAQVTNATAAGSFLPGAIGNRLGFALSAVTTGNTNADLLCDIRRW